MKIISSGKGIHSPEFYRKKQRAKKIRRIWLGSGLLILLISLIVVLRQKQLLISEVIVAEEDITREEEVIKLTEDLLAGNYLWIVPRANAFFYPKGTIEEAIHEKFPRFKSIDLDLTRFRELKISLEERTSFALYCTKMPEFKNTSGCYFLDKEGLVFDQAPAFSGDVYFIYIDKDKDEEPLGTAFLEKVDFELLTKFIKSLESLNIHPLALTRESGKYHLEMAEGGEIIWRANDDLELVHANLEAFLTEDSIRNQPDFLQTVLYMDLRTENKVFYKSK